MHPNDIEAELSYAYLHAVAAHAGVACQVATRAHDNLGVDATLSLVRDFGEGAVLSDISLHVQLKATVVPPARKDRRLSYFLDDVGHYDRLRAESAYPARLLAVLFLPPDHAQWLECSPERLALYRAAYWVSLRGAPATDNRSGQTIYLPESQPLSPAGLLDLFGRVARREELRYVY
ncbi:MAG: DUF4365 domain-containing protein [Nannocystaceae bacterium]